MTAPEGDCVAGGTPGCQAVSFTTRSCKQTMNVPVPPSEQRFERVTDTNSAKKDDLKPDQIPSECQSFHPTTASQLGLPTVFHLLFTPRLRRVVMSLLRHRSAAADRRALWRVSYEAWAAAKRKTRSQISFASTDLFDESAASASVSASRLERLAADGRRTGLGNHQDDHDDHHHHHQPAATYQQLQLCTDGQRHKTQAY